VSTRKTIADLIDVMAALRHPETGCPWDLEQDFRTIAPYTLEEAYEVADAIERGDLAHLREELGDLLLQVVYHARLAEEQGAFAFPDVVAGITEKMIRRHPHVFGDAAARNAGAAKDFWETAKAAEKAAKAAATTVGSPPPGGEGLGVGGAGSLGGERLPSLLDDIPVALPALVRAVKLQSKAARVGFDWPSLAPVFDKMREELAELEEVALTADPHDGNNQTQGASGPSHTPARADAPGPDKDAIEDEFGDLLFVMANVARHLSIDPEAALRRANDKFRRRFRHIESRLAAAGRTPQQSTLAEMDALWDEAKARE
jgi:ATP diphosphatase